MQWEKVRAFDAQVLREALAKHGGYEINTEGDSFQIAFKSVVEAVGFCMDAQYKLLETPWTRDVLRLPTCRCVHLPAPSAHVFSATPDHGPTHDRTWRAAPSLLAFFWESAP